MLDVIGAGRLRCVVDENPTCTLLANAGWPSLSSSERLFWPSSADTILRARAQRLPFRLLVTPIPPTTADVLRSSWLPTKLPIPLPGETTGSRLKEIQNTRLEPSTPFSLNAASSPSCKVDTPLQWQLGSPWTPRKVGAGGSLWGSRGIRSGRAGSTFRIGTNRWQSSGGSWGWTVSAYSAPATRLP